MTIRWIVSVAVAPFVMGFVTCGSWAAETIFQEQAIAEIQELGGKVALNLSGTRSRTPAWSTSKG